MAHLHAAETASAPVGAFDTFVADDQVCAARTPFFLSRNEHDLAGERPEAWRIYRVHLFGQAPRIFTIAPPLAPVLHLRTESWRASFG